jgi:ankyrin repeat protein
MVSYLLEQGADPNKSGAGWSKPLVWAKRKGHDEVAELLMQHGALE